MEGVGIVLQVNDLALVIELESHDRFVVEGLA